MLRSANRPYMERRVLFSEVDIALVTGRPKSSNLIVEPYRKEKLIAFVARNHPLASKREPSLSDFARVPLVIHGRKNSSNTVVSILQDLKRKGVKPVVAVRSESPDAVKTAVREKIGMGILYQGVLRRDLGKGEFISVKLSGLKLEAESFVIWHSDRPLSSAALGFLPLLGWWRTKQLERLGTLKWCRTRGFFWKNDYRNSASNPKLTLALLFLCIGILNHLFSGPRNICIGILNHLFSGPRNIA